MAELKRLHPLWPSVATAVGLAALLVGERSFSDTSTARLVLSTGGALAVLIATGARIVLAFGAPADRRVVAGRLALTTSLVLVGVGAYGVTLVVDPASSEMAARLSSSAWAAFIILLFAGGTPLVFIEAAVAPVAFNPAYEGRRIDHAWARGLSLGLLVPVLLLANFLAERHDLEKDFSLGRGASVSDQTREVVRELTNDVDVVLFFPERNEVLSIIGPYFDELAAESDRLAVRRADQALARDEAEKAKVPRNGYVALIRGEATKTIRLGLTRSSASGVLRSFDRNFLKALFNVAFSKKVAYFTVGHGERPYERPRRDDARMPVSILGDYLEDLQYDVRPLGLAQGLQDVVPEDAGIVFVMAPQQELLESEQESLLAFLRRGGRVLVAADADSDARLAKLLGPTGVVIDDGVLADEATHVNLTRSSADRAAIATNGYVRHKSVDTLALRPNAATVFFRAAVLEVGDAEAGLARKVTIESLPTTFADRNDNLELDDDEKTAKRALLVAITTTSTTGEEGRLALLADVDAVGDGLASAIGGNVALVRDLVAWLQIEDEPVLAVDQERDVKIVHREEEDAAVFFGATFGMPLLLLGLGWAVQRRRRR